jgi:phosphoribosyl 1,2-cyclic phosphodiesterase
VALSLKVWGCRGSIATPSSETRKYGGNTSCVEVLLDGDTAVVLDAGSGMRPLGLELARRGTRHVHLFLTHLHLDHLEGLRFFAPLWNPEVTVDIWGPRSPVLSLRNRILRAFSPPLFPLDFRDIPAQVTFHDLPAEPCEVAGVRVASDRVLHPGPTLGFRLECGGSTAAYLPDHEPVLAGIEDLPLDWLSGGTVARDVDVLLHDAQYGDAEYPARIGWGHSSVGDAVSYCNAVGADRLVLFHHEPEHSDEMLEKLEDHARALTSADRTPPVLAREGTTIEA